MDVSSRARHTYSSCGRGSMVQLIADVLNAEYTATVHWALPSLSIALPGFGWLQSNVCWLSGFTFNARAKDSRQLRPMAVDAPV